MSTEWQDIASAPRDREILIYDGTGVYTAVYANHRHGWYASSGGERCCAWQGGSHYEFMELFPMLWADMPRKP